MRCDDAAIKARQGVREDGSTGLQCLPMSERKPVLLGQIALARKGFGKRLLFKGQRIQCKNLIFDEQMIEVMVAVETNKHGRWIVRNRAYCRNRNAAAARRTIRGKDMNRLGKMAHGIAKCERLYFLIFGN